MKSLLSSATFFSGDSLPRDTFLFQACGDMNQHFPYYAISHAYLFGFLSPSLLGLH